MTTPFTPSSPQGRPAGSGFFDWVRQQGITRSPDRWFGGVAAGIARRLGWDPILVRGIFVVTSIFSGLGCLFYGLAWLVLPEQSDGRIHLEELIRGRLSAGFWGGAVFVFLGLIAAPTWLGLGGPIGLALILGVLIAGIVLLAYAGNRGRATPSPQPPYGGAPYPGQPPYAPPYPGQAPYAPPAPEGAAPTSPFVPTNQEPAMTAPNVPVPPVPAGPPSPDAVPSATSPTPAEPDQDAGRADPLAAADTGAQDTDGDAAATGPAPAEADQSADRAEPLGTAADTEARSVDAGPGETDATPSAGADTGETGAERPPPTGDGQADAADGANEVPEPGTENQAGPVAAQVASGAAATLAGAAAAGGDQGEKGAEAGQAAPGNENRTEPTASQLASGAAQATPADTAAAGADQGEGGAGAGAAAPGNENRTSPVAAQAVSGAAVATLAGVGAGQGAPRSGGAAPGAQGAPPPWPAGRYAPPPRGGQVPPGPPAAPPPYYPPPKQRRLPGGLVTLTLVGLMLLVLAGIAALGAFTYGFGNYSSAAIAFGAMLVMLGAGLMLLGALGRRFGSFLAAGLTMAVLAAPVLEATGWDRHPWYTRIDGHRVSLRASAPMPVGDIFVRPSTADEAEETIHVTAGTTEVDLTDPFILEERDVTVDISMTAGQTTLILPLGVPVELNASWTAGNMTLDDLDPDEWIFREVGGRAVLDGEESSGRDPRDPESLPSNIGGAGVDVTLSSRVQAGGAHPHTLTVNFQGTFGQLDVEAESSER